MPEFVWHPDPCIEMRLVPGGWERFDTSLGMRRNLFMGRANHVLWYLDVEGGEWWAVSDDGVTWTKVKTPFDRANAGATAERGDGG